MRPLTLTLLLPSLTLASPLAQRSPILNTTYVSPIFHQSLPTIINISYASVRHLVSSDSIQNNTDWKAQNAWTTVAIWDLQRKTCDFEEVFGEEEVFASEHQSGCFSYWAVPLVDCFNDDAAWSAMAAIVGWRAYEDEGLLEKAKGVWEFITNHGFINETAIEKGYLEGTHYPWNKLQAECDGKSMLGGVYWQNGNPTVPNNKAAADPQIDSGSTAGYALLSAKLCLITGDKTYCDKGTAAMQFFDRFFLDPETGFARGHIDGNNCSQPTEYLITTITAGYIGAYALLGNITANSTMISIARRTAIKAMTSSVWNTPQGVLFEEPSSQNPAGRSVVGFMGILIRRLHLIYGYMDAELQDAIRQYVNIQYWSLVTRDSDDAKKPLVFGGKWTGPFEKPEREEDALKWQFQAIDVINAVLALNPDDAFPERDGDDCAVVGLRD